MMIRILCAVVCACVCKTAIAVYTLPSGLFGLFRRNNFVLLLNLLASSCASSFHSALEMALPCLHYTDNRINEPISLPLQSDQRFDHLQSYQSSDSQQETEENLSTVSTD